MHLMCMHKILQNSAIIHIAPSKKKSQCLRCLGDWWCYLIYYRISHFIPFFFWLLFARCAIRTHRIASSKTCLRFDCVRAEHSMYLYAFNSSLNAFPCAVVTNCPPPPCSSRMSAFVPTRMTGTPGACCVISGIHLLLTFSYEVIESSEKHIRKTSVPVLKVRHFGSGFGLGLGCVSFGQS
jgi:hypothetical protein